MPTSRALLALFALAGASSGCINDIFERDNIDPQPEFPSFDRDGGFPFMDAAPPPPARLALVNADGPPPPISGGTLAVAADGKLAVAADSDRDVVYIVKPDTLAFATVALPEGSEPGRTVLDSSGSAHVVLRNADKVVRIDLANATADLATRVCQHPRGVAYDASADALLVACANGELVTLAAKTHAELSRVFIALDLRDVIITKSGQRFVSRYRSAELLQIDAQGKVVATTQPQMLHGTSVTGQSVSLSPTLAWRTIGTADGRPLMLHQAAQNEEIALRPGGYGGGCQAITRPTVTAYDEQGRPKASTSFLASALAVDIALSPDGTMLAVASPGAYLKGGGSLGMSSLALSEAVAVDAGAPAAPSDAGLPVTASDAGRPTADAGRVPADAGPPRFDSGIVRPPSGGSCNGFQFVDATDVQVTAVAFDATGRLFVFSREPAQLRVYGRASLGLAVRVERTIPLHTRSVRDTGHDMFHADVGSGLSCASCHGEARDDGHVWNFEGAGPRRTQNMRGGMLSTLPLHWKGDMRDFGHLVDEVMTGRMGGFRVEPQYADALAGWIDAQPEMKVEPSDASAAVRGKALFDSKEVACASCHSGPQLTNNSSVDVGTGEVMQVPSLLGLALRAPFMHDGCAKTLRERFDPNCGGGDRHGKTSQLSAPQLADLVSYLESL